MKSYIMCPVCGNYLGKSEKMDNYETACFKCHTRLLINTDDRNYSVTIIDDATEPVVAPEYSASKSSKRVACR